MFKEEISTLYRPRAGPGRRLPALLLAGLFLVCVAPLQADSRVSRADKIKAAIVFKLTRYVEWPDSAYAATNGKFRLCMLGHGAFAAALYAAEGRKVRGYPVEFQTVGSGSAAALRCHVLFITASRSRELGGLLAGLKGEGVLSISDIKGFAARGGVIGLVKSKTRIGFEINLNMARQAGLSISSQLLDLATLVAE